MLEKASPIVVGPGETALPPAGHKRREALKKRAERLEQVADAVVNAVDAPVYKVDPKLLKEDPEILKHFNPQMNAFEVSNPKPGYAYYWECYTVPQALTRKRGEVRLLLGPSYHGPGWEVVGACSCVGNKHGNDCPFPEAQELKQADGTRKIGDVMLLRIPLDTYIEMQKRVLLMVRFKEMNISETFTEFVDKYGGRVRTIRGSRDPRQLYAEMAHR